MTPDRANLMDSIDYHALDILQVPFLKSYLHYNEPGKRYPYLSKDNKDANICQVLSNSSFKEFLDFCDMFDLDTVEDADEYLDKAIETKKLASKKDVNTTKDVDDNKYSFLC